MKLIVSEFVTLDGVMQGPGAQDEDVDGGFQNGGWVPPLFDDGIGAYFGEVMQTAGAVLLGRRTYVSHAGAFAADPANDPFAGMKKYVVTKTLTEPLWSDTVFIRDNPMAAIRALKAQPGKDILTDGSCQLVHAMLEHDLVDDIYLLIFPVVVGSGKRVFPNGLHRSFTLIESKSTPNGIIIARYTHT